MASDTEEGLGSGEYDPSVSADNDVELLKRAWRNEKASPEILQFQESLVQRVREQIQLVEDNIEDNSVSSGGIWDPLTVSLYQMDLDRTQFLLRSYLRLRLQKIEKYTIHITKTEAYNRLSKQEQKFAARCTDNLEKHLSESVLSKLPDGYQSILKQCSSSEEDDMVPEPQLDTFVFCKSRGNIGPFQIDDEGKEVVDMLPDDLYVLPYKEIKPLVGSGQIDLV